jgi:hypothetical protein
MIKNRWNSHTKKIERKDTGNRIKAPQKEQEEVKL